MMQPLVLMKEKVLSAVEGFFLLLPNIIAALLLLVAWYGSKLVAAAITRISVARGRPDLGSLLGSLARVVLIITTLLFCAAIVFPTVNPGDIIGALGIGSVAIGFAIRQPYKRGDQIVVKGYEGTVEQIESRATFLKTYDGLRVIIPNSDVYTSPVVVNTAYEWHRDELVVGIGYGDNPAEAIEYFHQAVNGVEGVSSDMGVEVIPWSLNDYTVGLKVRWWSHSSRLEQVQVKGVDLPFPTSVVLFHDQTEEIDGDRTRQREGWPAGKNPPQPKFTKPDEHAIAE